MTSNVTPKLCLLPFWGGKHKDHCGIGVGVTCNCPKRQDIFNSDELFTSRLQVRWAFVWETQIDMLLIPRPFFFTLNFLPWQTCWTVWTAQEKGNWYMGAWWLFHLWVCAMEAAHRLCHISPCLEYPLSLFCVKTTPYFQGVGVTINSFFLPFFQGNKHNTHPDKRNAFAIYFGECVTDTRFEHRTVDTKIPTKVLFWVMNDLNPSVCCVLSFFV